MPADKPSIPDSRQRLEALVNPRSIVLIGASPDPAKLSGRPLAYLRRYGFEGSVYAVNPKYRELDGVPCYPDIAALPAGIDLALILLPAKDVPGALKECGRAGIRYAISIAGGFAEAGNLAGQAQLEQCCATYGIRLIGPNCVGLLNPRRGVTATFSSELQRRMPRPGSTVLLTQSGALGNSLLQSFNDLDIGLATWISMGNEADLGVLELLEHFIDDSEAELIVLFVEGLKQGERLLPLARQAHAAGKTVVVLRAGRSQLGRAASVSHTGKLAGAWKVWRDVSAQAGLIEIQSLDELVDLALAFDRLGNAGQDAAQGLGVLTISGGLGVLVSDAAAEYGVPLPAFAAGTQQKLRAILPPQMGVANPVDTALFTDERGYALCAEAVLEDDSIGILLLVLTSLAHDYAALVPWIEQLAARARAGGKHIAVSFLSSSDQLPREARQRLIEAGVLVLPTAERVVAALGRRLAAQRILQAATGTVGTEAEAGAGAAIGTGAGAGTGTSERQRLADAASAAPRPDDAGASGVAPTVAGFLQRARVPQVPECVCTELDRALSFADRSGYPVVLKVVSPDIAHKSEVGGVALGLADRAALGAAWRTMKAAIAAKAPHASITGYSVQPQVGAGLELIVGCSIDPELGRVAMVGAGGIYAEVLDDVRFIGLPASDTQVRDALLSLRIAPRFGGVRGEPALDLESAVSVVQGLARQFLAEPWVREIDLNPLLVQSQGRGSVALDVLVVAAGDREACL